MRKADPGGGGNGLGPEGPAADQFKRAGFKAPSPIQAQVRKCICGAVVIALSKVIMNFESEEGFNLQSK